MRFCFFLAASALLAAASGTAMAGFGLGTPKPTHRVTFYYLNILGAPVGTRTFQCNGFVVDWGVLEGDLYVEKEPCD